jgi:SPP1 family phage portal protein
MIFRLPKDKEMDLSLLDDFLGKHKRECVTRYEKLYNAYKSDHDILHANKKADWKPDNRIVVNFPKYIIDTMNGFFIGNPIKIVAQDAAVSEFVEFLDQYNDQDDNNAELSKISSIFGHGYEMYYTDEEGELCITYLSPLESFMVYDESIVERPLFFVRRYVDYNNDEYGSISNNFGVRNFKVTGGLRWLDDWQAHNFDDVPATEFVENAERQGLFEPVMSMVNAYNKTISDKANDIDYFSDAYLKILGVELHEDETRYIRDNRIINLSGDDAEKIIVEFMAKPSGDVAQENHLNRLERLIFQISMVANISDENFGASSGIALKYKLQAMSNLEKTKERKFASGMNRRYKLLFGHPSSKVPADAWVQLSYVFVPNIPANLLEEAQIAAQLEGITSHKTQLTVLSCVDNVEDELDLIEEENKPDENSIIDRLAFGFKDHDETAEGSAPDEPEDVANGTETE